MNRTLLAHYEHELEHLRSVAAEFGRQFPKVAGRLAIDPNECRDPYVERLLEGFAFLAARVQVKLEAEFPRFTETLLNIVYPQYLAPVPAMVMVQFSPELTEAGLALGFVIPRGTTLRSQRASGEPTSCEFRTGHSVKLFPLRVTGSRYFARDAGVLGLESGPLPKAAIKIELEATAGVTFDKMALDELPLFISAGDATRMRLYEQILADATSVIIRVPKSADPFGPKVPPPVVLEPDSIRRVGFSESEGLLPADVRTFHGYRLLTEYFAFPQRFMSVNFTGLRAALAKLGGNRIEIIVTLGKEDQRLERAIDASTFVPFCTPAINLFPRRADRIFVSDQRPEHQVVIDRTRPIDYEVHSISRVIGYSGSTTAEREFLPFYAATDWDDRAGGAYFMLHRVPRTETQRERTMGGRSISYKGSEVYISLVDAQAIPYGEDLRQLSVEALCTNRDLPIQMPVGRGARDFDIELGAPLASIRCLGTPSAPRPAPTDSQVAWRAIGHLAQNYLSLANVSGGSSPAALRDLLRLYAHEGDSVQRQQVEGVRAVACAPITRRVPTPGPITFVRGLEVGIELDESMFEGTGVFLLGAVLEQFFARYVSSNALTETVIRTPQRGEIKRWPAIVGQRPML